MKNLTVVLALALSSVHFTSANAATRANAYAFIDWGSFTATGVTRPGSLYTNATAGSVGASWNGEEVFTGAFALPPNFNVLLSTNKGGATSISGATALELTARAIAQGTDSEEPYFGEALTFINRDVRLNGTNTQTVSFSFKYNLALDLDTDKLQEEASGYSRIFMNVRAGTRLIEQDLVLEELSKTVRDGADYPGPLSGTHTFSYTLISSELYTFSLWATTKAAVSAPEPTTLSFLTLGSLALVMVRRRR